MKLTLDTGIILAFVLEEEDKDLEGLEKLFQSINVGKYTANISTITVSEIFAAFSKLGEAKKAVETIVSLKEMGILIVDVNENIAKAGGIFKAKYSRAKKGFSYADAIVLATSLFTESDALVTYDPEFSGILEIKILKPENL